MTLRRILHYPDARLRRKAAEVKQFDAELRALSDDMLQTMYASGGIGLAAPQIDVPLRLVVVDLGEQENPAPEALVNPSYRALPEAEPVMIGEGCLSVPKLRVDVERYSAIEFRWQDLDGQQHCEKPQSILRCICLQHELDHLDGRLIVDYLSRMQREKYKRLLRKAPEQQEEMHATAVISGAKASGSASAKPKTGAQAAADYARISKSRGRKEYDRRAGT